ncbi:M15 family metallopeptidase [Agaribacter flavus]|uniref:M15 family metallopeptidase n=1 Tax=Agaribacter flavus TaxID=1902781 RepID=A0ABV7FVM1_9ALTE
MQKGRVKSVSGLNLRDKPNGSRVDVLGHREEFTIVDEVTFYRVKTSTGKIGYVHGDFIEKTPSAELLPAAQPILENTSFKAVTYSHPLFLGEKVTVDEDFTFELNRLGDFADSCELKIWVTSSLRLINQQVRGAIVTPASKSCHHIGHAIDMNLIHQGNFYNSKKLRKSNHANLPDAIVSFFNLIRQDEVLRWGGDFRDEDPVHIDDNFYRRKTLYYKAKLQDRVEQLNGQV